MASKPSDMSFSVADQRTGLEWRGTSFSTVFAQRRNLARPDFLRMLADVARFNRLARGLLADPPPDGVTLEEVLAPHRWSAGFRDWYLVPLGSSIWSADPSTFTQIPAATFARFFERHGLLRLRDQPKWRTVDGGSKRYVDAILSPVAAGGPAPTGEPGGQDPPRTPVAWRWSARPASRPTTTSCWPPTAIRPCRLLSDPDRVERQTLSALRYQSNRAVLHTDVNLLPTERRAWASWNYHRLEAERDEATLTYYLNRLQGIDSATPVLVTLNHDDGHRPRQGTGPHGVRPPGAGPGCGTGQDPPRRDQRHPAHLVRRRLLGLRLSRGRGT